MSRHPAEPSPARPTVGGMTLFLIMFVLAALALARITRLITTDKIGEPLRMAVLNWRGQDSMVTYLLFCPWCISMWLAPAAAAVLWWPLNLADMFGVTAWIGYPLLVFALAHTAAWILAKED